ncbi:RecF/RecN/SMC N terminal domain [Candidatus Fokinia solitaria]|uniref:RecF/RecN/SMC N terminal domain n=1 Tax=Candidatus Fokinia solitaria TaxID=1802984 RepID=A0A2U8BS63_9RICK|nr:AAA family ATPase [Candidatus Fokinia solitaria]AWD33120.1 RecF/RecN/SMC N terminal domain [Candidatus Fokinia solitaria]
MKLDVTLKHCYGIQNLEKKFDFSQCRTVVIYASNAVMKTSFARTFLQLQEEKRPSEEIYGLESEFNIKLNDNDIKSSDIFVIKTYREKYESENISKLLVDEKRQKEYEEIWQSIAKNQTSLMVALNKSSGIEKSRLEKTILSDFKDDSGNFLKFLEGIKIDEITDSDCNYVDVKYSLIFNQKVEELLKNKDVTDNIERYTKQYNELLDKSPYFDRTKFNPSKADSVLKTLEKQKFFASGHKVKLKGKKILLDKVELQKVLDEAKKAILQDSELKRIQNLITEGQDVKDFQDLLEETPEIINELSDLSSFREKLWKSYFKKDEEKFRKLVEEYQQNRENLTHIEDAASKQLTTWSKVVDIFRERFKVPFELEIKNKKSAILGREKPHIAFIFKDKNGLSKELNRDTLEGASTLSQGEKRALYLLQIIFEIENRKQSNTRTLFIIDDIADSFDYQNKYAIIEYLKELHTEENNFYQIILTHNFDFFRTAQERILTDENKRTHSFIAQKNDDSISLFEAGHRYIVSPFSYWKTQLKGEIGERERHKILIAMIPFMRELLHYISAEKERNSASTDKKEERNGTSTGEKKDCNSASIDKKEERNDTSTDKKEEYCRTLTALLHVKSETKNLKFCDLNDIYKDLFDIALTKEDKDICIFDALCAAADDISERENDSALNLENKIILSIAARLMAEYYMESRDISLKDKIGQTFNRFKKKYEKDEATPFLERVVIMTPENIHLNSFMYEPILDMSEQHLKKLYKDVRELYKSISSTPATTF